MTGNFTEQWIAQETLSRLESLTREVADVPGAIIEFGCWEGRSLTRIAAAAAPRIVHAVDHWNGNTGDITAKIVQTRDVFGKFQENIAHLNNVQVHRESNEIFMGKWRKPIALLHLDADHNYIPVRDQIEWALPLLSKGAVLCGDDYSGNWPGVVQAVDEMLPGRSVEVCMWIHRND